MERNPDDGESSHHLNEGRTESDVPEELENDASSEEGDEDSNAQGPDEDTDQQQKQRSEHRLVLQLVICGGIAIGCGFLSIIWHIVRGVFSLLTRRDATVAALRWLGERAHFYLHALRVTAEVLIVAGLLFAFMHRILGFALSYYLQTTLDPQRIGQYQFNFKWISLRLGLDQNMLVISGFEWRNPPEFTNTPYLLHIDEISFIIDPWSIYGAITRDEAIRIKEIKLHKARIYIEKLTQRSLNRARQAKAGSRLESQPSTDVADTEGSNTPTELDSNDPSPQKRGPRPGVLNLYAAMGATDEAQEASVLSRISGKITSTVDGATNMVQILGSVAGRLNVGDTLLRSAQSVTNTIGRTLTRAFSGRPKGGRARRGSNADRSRSGTLDSVTEGGEDGDEDGNHSPVREGHMLDTSGHPAEMTVEETLALLHEEFPDLVLPPLPEDALDEEDRQQQAERLQQRQEQQQQQQQQQQKKKKKEVESWKGFGIPYLLEIDFLLLHDLRVHAQDFVTADRTDELKGSVVKVNTLAMGRKELTRPPDRAVGGHRRGIYLDDVVWRLVNKLLSELFRNNSIAMLMLLTTAATSHTTSVVNSASSIATLGASSGSKLFNQAASTTSETAKVALNAVNNSTAEAAREVRSALNSVGQFLKRTARKST